MHYGKPTLPSSRHLEAQSPSKSKEGGGEARTCELVVQAVKVVGVPLQILASAVLGLDAGALGGSLGMARDGLIKGGVG